MVSDWKRVPLDQVADVIDSRHKTPQYVEVGIPMVRVVDVKGGALNFSETKKVSSVDYTDYSKGRDPEAGDLIISRVGSYGNISYVNDASRRFCLGQNTALIVPKIHWRYLYFQLRSSVIKLQIEENVVGAVQKTISLKSIKSLDITVPSFSEQERIAHILGSLDDKIELNRQMNATLEGMAQALFKSWFVDFDPVIDNALAAGNPIPEAFVARAETRRKVLAHGTANRDVAKQFPAAFQFTEEMGWIPEGWELSTIGDEVIAVGGGTPSTKNELFWNGVHSFCTPKDMSQLSSLVLSDTERHLTDLGAQKISSGILPEGTVLMSSRAPIGYLAISEMPIVVNQGIIALLKNDTYQPMFLMSWLRSNMENIKERANGSTFLEISKKNFKPLPFLKSSEKPLLLFNEQAKSIHMKIVSCVNNTNHLTKLRDTLLPKLISGEIRIPEAEKLTEEALA